MNAIRQAYGLLGAFWRWYFRTFLSNQMIRVDPVTILTLIGIITTTWGISRGLGAEATAENLASSLREAPTKLNEQISRSHQGGQISGYDREVALQRVEMLRPVFQQYATIIQIKGNELASQALEQGLVEALAGLNPAEAAGRLVGGLTTAKGIDRIIGTIFIANSINEFEAISRPFSAEEASLRSQINTILGMNADRLFLARMRHKINWSRAKWQDLKSEYPDDPGKAEEYLRWEIYNRATSWAENPRLYGPGEKWTTLNDYIDWLVNLAKSETATEQLSVNTIKGDATTYSGSLGWWQFGSDVAPQLGMCSEIMADILVDRLDLEIGIHPDQQTISGKISGHASGQNTPNERQEATFSGTISSGIAARLDAQYWEFNGLADIPLSLSVYDICVGDASNPGMVLDVSVEETIQAQVFGNSQDGACVWWGEKMGNGDLKRSFMLYTQAMKDRCNAAIMAGASP